MVRHLAWRLFSALPVLLAVSFLTFLIPQVTPGDPARIVLGPEAPVEDVQRLHHDLGLDQPLLVQYGRYLGKVIRGDLGDSIVYRQPVFQLVAERLPVTLLLAVSALLVGTLAAIPLGVIAALNRGKARDVGTMVAALLGVSTPSFVVALLLIYFFAYKHRLFPSTGLPSFGKAGWGTLRYLVLPTAALATSSVALSARLLRSSMLEVLNQDYVRTARAKGLGGWRLVRVHCLKNALIPMVTVMGLQFGVLIGGAVVTETVFALPGVGRLAVDAISARDFPVVQGIVLFIAISIVLINVVVDLVYRWLDPRVSVG